MADDVTIGDNSASREVPGRPRRQRQKRKDSWTDAVQISREEQKLIKQAIRNSLIEQKNTTEDLDQIEEMKVFKPSLEQFKDPITYIEYLIKEKQAYQYGCIKIIPPPDFRPPLAFDTESEQRLPTRY